MAEQLYFSRDTKFFVVLESAGVPTQAWEIPILDGFSFSQATNSSDITLAEMQNSSGVSRRGMAKFNDSLAPGEWSFTTYVRPYLDGSTKVHAMEEPLWALMAGADTYTSGAFLKGASAITFLEDQATGSYLNFDQSNASTVGTASFFFVMDTGATTGDNGPDPLVYKLADAVVNEASIDFDVDGIAQISWSGFASRVTDFTNNTFYQPATPLVTDNKIGGGTPEVGDVWLESDNDSAFSICTAATPTFIPAIDDAVCSTNNFIRNRLTQVTAIAAQDSWGAFPGVNDNGVYNITLTGGNITISNNITYLTPEELGCVNIPIGHVTGSRSVTGNMTAYVTHDATGAIPASVAGTTRALFLDMTSSEGLAYITNSFALTFNIGGTTVGTEPVMVVTMPTAHIEIPTHSIDDVISLEIGFTALPSTISGTDEIGEIRWHGSTVEN
jgi:hypothetical protein